MEQTANMYQDAQVYLTDMGRKLLSSFAKANHADLPPLFPQKDEIQKRSAKHKMDIHGRPTGLKSNRIPVAHAADPLRDPEDIRRFQEYFLRKGDVRGYTLFTLGICFGLRIGDLLSLHFYDLMTTKSSFKRYVEIYEDKTNKLNRIFITPLAVSAMETYIEYLNQTAGFRMTDYLFKSRKTRWQEYGEEEQSPLTPQAVHTILKKAARDLGIQGNISTHTLRKTFSYWSLKLNSGDAEALYTLQSALNHSDTRNTLKYAGISQDNVDALRSDVSQFFQEEGEEDALPRQRCSYTPQDGLPDTDEVKLPSCQEDAVYGDTDTFAPVYKNNNSLIGTNSPKKAILFPFRLIFWKILMTIWMKS